MELRPEFLLPAIAKSLRDVVRPAVDPDNGVAQEQLNLAIGFLNVLAERLPLFFAFDVDELRRHLELGEALAGLLGAEYHRNTAMAEATQLLGSSGSDPAAIVATSRKLRQLTAHMIEIGHARAEPLLSAAISRTMNAFAKVQLDSERAWVMPMGFETGSDPIPDIASQLAEAVS